MMDEHLSTNTNQPDKPPPLKEKQVWIIGMGVLGVILGLLLLSEITLLFFKNKGWTTHTSGRWVSALAVDKEDRIWAAYYRSTMLYPDDGEPVQIPLNAEMADDSVRSLAVDGQNRIWAGTASGFVCMRDIDGQWTIYTPENPENDNTIWDIVIDGQDRAWVRSISGLGMIDPSASGTIYTFRNSGLTDSEVRAIAVDNKGRLWASSKRMLKILYSDGNWALRAAAPSFGSGLAIDEQGQVWVQTLDGIGVLGLNGDWKSYRLGTYIGPIVADKKGRIWVSRFGELLMFDPDTGWTTYHTLNSGLNDSGVNALVADRQNRVWMGTNDGLRVFDEEEALSPTSVQKIVVLTNSIIPSAAVGNTLIIVLDSPPLECC